MSTLLQINKISKSFGPHVIFNEASFNIEEKHKIGVIGRNGEGKTTLFKMIIGSEKIDDGEIVISDGTKIGYLEQQKEFNDTETVLDFLLRDSGKESWECAIVAGKFQLKGELLDSKIKKLSGGYQMRVKLSTMLLRDPNLLFLDEPTNHLDLSTLLLLEEFLKTYTGSYLVISHDREFLCNTCDKTLEVDQGKLYSFPCSIDEYLEHKETERKTNEKYNKKINQQKKHLQSFVDRFGAKASKAAQAQSRVKQIKKLETISIRKGIRVAQIVIPEIEHKKGFALRIKDLDIGYPKKTIANKISIDINRGDHIAVLGDNGHGKSTFLNTLYGEIDKIGGDFRWMPNIKIASYSQHMANELDPKEQIGTYLEAQAGENVNTEDILRIAGNFLFYGNDIKKSVSVLSGGEKARLCIAGILLKKCNVLLLDEPTNHLDFETVEMLAEALSKSNATVLFISHNRDFIHTLANNIIEVGDGAIRMSNYNYEDYLYHLYLKSDIERKQPNEKNELPKDKAIEKEEKRIKFEKAKKLKNKLKKLQERIKKNKAEEEKLLKKYEENNYQYSQEEINRMNNLKELISREEEEEFKVEGELEEI